MVIIKNLVTIPDLWQELKVLCLPATGDKVRNVLIIGDYISIGYPPFVEKTLASDILVTHFRVMSIILLLVMRYLQQK